jgi:predicted MFS family arabinose efflux permease
MFVLILHLFQPHLARSTTSVLRRDLSQTSAAAPPPPRITVGVAVRLFVRRLFDRDLLHSATFILFVSALSLGQGGFVDACFFVPPFAVERWRSKKLASMLIMLLGIADFVGRLSGGWFADLGLVRRHLIMAVSFFVAGLSIFLVTFFRSFMLMATATIVLSGFGGCYLALVAVILADLFGLHKLPPSIGLNSLAMGLATLPLPPILGLT